MTIRRLLLFLVLVFPLLGQRAEARSLTTFRRFGNWRIYGNGPNYLALGAGAFNLPSKGNKGYGVGRLEVRFGKKLFFIGPAIGLLVNADGGFMGYGGIYADIAYKRLVITPCVGAGGYENGEGKDLGGPFEFRSSLTLAYQFDNLSRLGVQIAHVSNADLRQKNPGEQDLLLTFDIPF